MHNKIIKIKKTGLQKFEFHIPEGMGGDEFLQWRNENFEAIKNLRISLAIATKRKFH